MEILPSALGRTLGRQPQGTNLVVNGCDCVMIFSLGGASAAMRKLITRGSVMHAARDNAGSRFSWSVPAAFKWLSLPVYPFGYGFVAEDTHLKTIELHKVLRARNFVLGGVGDHCR